MQDPKLIAVGSMNPVKANAVLLAFQRMFPGDRFRTECVAADSGVADQPKSDAETRLGAQNRVEFTRRQVPTADYWAGIEGGIEDSADGMQAFAWIVIQSQTVCGQSRTATFPLPDSVAELIGQGVELGHAADRLFGREDTKHNEGAIGILSENVIDRTMLYEHAAVLALVAVKNERFYAPSC